MVERAFLGGSDGCVAADGPSARLSRFAVSNAVVAVSDAGDESFWSRQSRVRAGVPRPRPLLQEEQWHQSDLRRRSFTVAPVLSNRDIDADGALTNFDIDPFVTLLLTQP